MLSEVEWLEFMGALPMQAREVIPKMLWDGTLQASNHNLSVTFCAVEYSTSTCVT